MAAPEEYRDFVNGLLHLDGKPQPIEFICLGLAGETGELKDAVMNMVAANSRTAVVSELGDLLWYLQALAIRLDIDLWEINVAYTDVDIPLDVSIGNIADAVKKHLWHGKPLDTGLVTKSMAQVLSCIADCAESIGTTVRGVAEANMAKLQARYPNGFCLGGGIR